MPRIRLRRKRRKTVKLRGKRYHGYGQVSGGHRGSGQRGGYGRAGVKDHMKIKLLKEGYEFGSRGFTPHGPFRYVVAINIGKLAELVKEGKIEAKQEHGKYVVDVTRFQYLRILGGGEVDIPLKLILSEKAHVTKKAEEKLKQAGGSVVFASAE